MDVIVTPANSQVLIKFPLVGCADSACSQTSFGSIDLRSLSPTWCHCALPDRPGVCRDLRCRVQSLGFRANYCAWCAESRLFTLSMCNNFPRQFNVHFLPYLQSLHGFSFLMFQLWVDMLTPVHDVTQMVTSWSAPAACLVPLAWVRKGQGGGGKGGGVEWWGPSCAADSCLSRWASCARLT